MDEYEKSNESTESENEDLSVNPSLLETEDKYDTINPSLSESNSLFPELQGINDNKESINSNINNTNITDNTDINSNINMDEEFTDKNIKKKDKKKKSDINPIDEIMNPKKKEKEQDVTFVFLLFIIIAFFAAIYFGIKNNIITAKMFGFNLKNNQLTCYYENIEEFEGKTEKHIFYYKGKTIYKIKSMYAFASSPTRLTKHKKAKEDIMSEAIGLKGIDYEDEISENTYKIWATYDIKKINFKIVRAKNNSDERVTLIDIASDMKYDATKDFFEKDGFICYVGKTVPEGFYDQTEDLNEDYESITDSETNEQYDESEDTYEDYNTEDLNEGQ